MDWEKAFEIAVEPVTKAESPATWAAVPESIDTGKKLKAIEKAFGEFLYSGQKLALFEIRDLELVSAPGEPLEAFRVRCRKAADEAKGRDVELERIKFKPRLEAAQQSTSKGREDRIARLEADFQAKCDEIGERYRRLGEKADELQIKPRKTDIRVTHFGLAWAPFWREGK